MIKPSYGAASKGVFVLETAETGYLDMMTGERYSRADLGDRLVDSIASTARVASSSGFIVEEYVGEEGEVPDDWKCYAFRGKVPLILQVRRRALGLRYKLYEIIDGHVVSLPRALGCHRAGRYDSTLPEPRHADELLIKARRLSHHMPTPFVRVDLYEDRHGVAFGEFALRPGDVQWFGNRRDRELGQLWETAAVGAKPEGDNRRGRWIP